MIFHSVSSWELGKNRTKSLSIRKHISWVVLRQFSLYHKRRHWNREVSQLHQLHSGELACSLYSFASERWAKNTRHRYPLINAPLLQLILVRSKYIRDFIKHYKGLVYLQSKLQHMRKPFHPTPKGTGMVGQELFNSNAEKSSYGQKWKQTTFPAETTE